MSESRQTMICLFTCVSRASAVVIVYLYVSFDYKIKKCTEIKYAVNVFEVFILVYEKYSCYAVSGSVICKLYKPHH